MMGLVKLVDCLCNQYKQLYIKCRGKMHTNFSAYVALHLHRVKNETIKRLTSDGLKSMKKILLLMHGPHLLLLFLSRLTSFPQTHNLQC